MHSCQAASCRREVIEDGERKTTDAAKKNANGCSSTFNLFLDSAASGAWNMAVDEVLLECAAADGQCSWRFYQWEEPTLSLGYFQSHADRARHPASGDCTMVRRTSGGGAILHDLELTYSVAVPADHPLAIDRLGTYRVVHEALIETLRHWGVTAALCGAHPRFSIMPTTGGVGRVETVIETRASQRQPFLCFQRRSPGDVLVDKSKIAGSAQRRCQGAILQHGSVLLARSVAAPELDGLQELSGRRIDVEELTRAWLNQLGSALAIQWRQARLSPSQDRQASLLAEEKYGSPVWTCIR
jgi:lipoate-protein ligase A